MPADDWKVLKFNTVDECTLCLASIPWVDRKAPQRTPIVKTYLDECRFLLCCECGAEMVMAELAAREVDTVSLH